MQLKPAALDRVPGAGAKLRVPFATLQERNKGSVDPLYVDAALLRLVLNRSAGAKVSLSLLSPRVTPREGKVVKAGTRSRHRDQHEDEHADRKSVV